MKPCSELVSPFDMKKWPKLASTKFDGIRGVTSENGLLSNSLKQIPNLFVQKVLADLPPFLDGELVLKGKAGQVYDNNQSAFMSRTGQPDFEFKVFDYAKFPSHWFLARLLTARTLCVDHEFAVGVEHELITKPEQAFILYDQARIDGYEGLILRDPDAIYKHGRSTRIQEMGMKMKPFDPDEAKVIGFSELHHNDNEQTLNEMGYTVRSKHQDNRVASGMLGSLVCNYQGNTFKIGTGFTVAQRIEIWHNQTSYAGKLARFKHQGITKAGVPRGPAVFLGWRDALDMGDV
jgi:DNA ligase-1